jgi:hypothetical protein
MIDYFRKVAPARPYAIHDAILSDNGLGIMTKLMALAAAPHQRASREAGPRHQPGAVIRPETPRKWTSVG